MNENDAGESGGRTGNAIVICMFRPNDYCQTMSGEINRVTEKFII